MSIYERIVFTWLIVLIPLAYCALAKAIEWVCK